MELQEKYLHCIPRQRNSVFISMKANDPYAKAFKKLKEIEKELEEESNLAAATSKQTREALTESMLRRRQKKRLSILTRLSISSVSQGPVVVSVSQVQAEQRRKVLSEAAAELLKKERQLRQENQFAFQRTDILKF
jgi:hypothetical protein